MLALEIVAVLLGVLSAAIGYSATFYIVIRLITNKHFKRCSMAYNKLYANKVVSDPVEVHDLLEFVRGYLAKYESPEYSQYGMFRRWAETVRLEFRPGFIDNRPNFVGVNPIYGYNEKGEETLVADHGTFDQTFQRAFSGVQQSTAFGILMVAFIVQLFAFIF